MSHSRIRIPKPPARRRPWLEFVAGAVMTVFIALFIFVRLADWRSPTHYSTAAGTILETRIAIAGARDSRYGGQIFYRIEARTRFYLEGQTQDRWLTASELTESRQLLVAKLAAQPRSCMVYWTPKHPENAKCRLD